LSRRTSSSAWASTPLISSFTLPRKTSAPTFSRSMSRTWATRETCASRFSTSREISSTLRFGTSRCTSGPSPRACATALLSPPSRAERPGSVPLDALFPMTPPQGRRYPGLTSGNVKAGSGGGFRLLLGLLGRPLRPVLGLLFGLGLRLLLRLALGLLFCLPLGLLVRLGLGLLLLLLQGLLVGLDDLAVADLAAPALDLVLFEQRARHHVALDVLEVEA